MVNNRVNLCSKQENFSKKSAVSNQEPVIMAHIRYMERLDQTKPITNRGGLNEKL